MSEWIDVNERLPDISGNFLTFNGYGQSIQLWNKNGWLNLYAALRITHWMPLPKPPSEVVV